MPKFTEETLDSWRKPASDTEEQKISNTIAMIKDAVKFQDKLDSKDIEFIVQGSYGNNTNIKLNSDIDICIMLKDEFYCDYRVGVTKDNYGFIDGKSTFADYKNLIISAMNNKFGANNVTIGNKSIKIKSNTYHVQADVVPAYQFRNYQNDTKNNPDNFIEGIRFYSSKNEIITNYPKIHIENGITKNTITNRKYKRAIRLYKRLRAKMLEDNVGISLNINSFLIEGLLWNTPDFIFSKSETWNDLLKSSILHIYNSLKEEHLSKEWGEVSEQFYLFHHARKWEKHHVVDFLTKMWNYLGY